MLVFTYLRKFKLKQNTEDNRTVLIASMSEIKKKYIEAKY